MCPIAMTIGTGAVRLGVGGRDDVCGVFVVLGDAQLARVVDGLVDQVKWVLAMNDVRIICAKVSGSRVVNSAVRVTRRNQSGE